MHSKKNASALIDYPFEVSRVTILSNNLKEIISEAGYSLNEPVKEIPAREFFSNYSEEKNDSMDQHSYSILNHKLKAFFEDNFNSFKIIQSGNHVYFVGYINNNYHMVISSNFVKTGGN